MINNDDDLNVIEFFANQSQIMWSMGVQFCFVFFWLTKFPNQILQNISRIFCNETKKESKWDEEFKTHKQKTRNIQIEKNFFFNLKKKYSNVVDCVMFEHWTKKNMNILSENWIFCFASSIYTEFGQEVWPNKLN